MARKILVVDEKPFMLRLIQHHLERAGYELIKAHNRVEALEAIVRQSPELVVMNDHCDSQADGPSSEQTRKATQRIPVIRMTDIPQTLDQDRPMVEGEVVLTKPFSPTHLVAEIKRLVSGS